MHLKGPILGVWAHPDDEAFLSAGLMAEAIRNGGRVVCITATRGEQGIQDPERWPPERLAEIRERELKASLEVLGVAEHEWFEYPDGGLTEVDADEATARVADAIRRVQPASILTFGPGGMTGHPDHIAVSRWTGEAFKVAAPGGARLYHAVKTHAWADIYLERMNDGIRVDHSVMPDLCDEDEAAIAFGLPDDLMALKERALRAQESQIGTILRVLGEPDAWEANRVEYFRLAAEA